MVEFTRNLSSFLSETVSQRPVVYLNGPRQAGKSWLVHNFYCEKAKNYTTLDSPLVLSSAKSNIFSFVSSLPKNKLNIIDEVQLIPDIARSIKILVDENRLNNISAEQFLLTGSANIMAVPKLSEALVGRVSVITLYPISSSEYKQTNINFIKRFFENDFFQRKYQEFDIVSVISNSTFPEIAIQSIGSDPVFEFDKNVPIGRINRIQWFGDYLNTILEKDIKVVANIRKPENLIRLLSSLTSRTASLLNNDSVMAEVGINKITYGDYKQFLTDTFLIYELKSFEKPNRIEKRFAKQKKLFFIDTNLLLYIMQRDLRDVYENDKKTMGHIFENFVFTEIIKNLTSLPNVKLSHFRKLDGKEVDFVIEKFNGDTIGIEVKLDSNIGVEDFKGLKVLKDFVGEKFIKGIVIYNGSELLSFGENFWAVPVCYFWMD